MTVIIASSGADWATLRQQLFKRGVLKYVDVIFVGPIESQVDAAAGWNSGIPIMVVPELVLSPDEKVDLAKLKRKHPNVTYNLGRKWNWMEHPNDSLVKRSEGYSVCLVVTDSPDVIAEKLGDVVKIVVRE